MPVVAYGNYNYFWPGRVTSSSVWQTGMDHRDSFITYLRSQKRMILASLGIAALSFILLKCLFPYPDMFVDSSSYIFWAFYKFDVAYRPTGYPYFLRFTHVVSEHHLFTVLIQYLFFLLSSLFCFFSVDFLYGLPGKLKWTILMLILLNPMLVLQTNLISSDTVFCSLTVTWFTLCLWILKKANWWVLLLQLLLLYCCFEVRFTTLFFPFVAVTVFLLCAGKWTYKITGALLTVALILFCVQRQKQLHQDVANIKIVSGFSGWQVANNALYCYKHINLDPNDLPSVNLQVVDRVVKRYIDSLPVNPGEIGVQYLWDKRSPLKVFCLQVMRHAKIDYAVAWMNVSKEYGNYGWYIIKTFPGAFMQYYILPNTCKYFYPDLEALTEYNSSNMAALPDETKQWFNYTVDHLECRVPGFQRVIMPVFPFLSLLLNLFNIVVLVFCSFRLIKAWKSISKDTRQFFFVWALFYFSFMAFSIFATAVNLRFMDLIFILGLIIPVVLWNKIRINSGVEMEGKGD